MILTIYVIGFILTTVFAVYDTRRLYSGKVTETDLWWCLFIGFIWWIIIPIILFINFLRWLAKKLSK